MSWERGGVAKLPLSSLAVIPLDERSLEWSSTWREPARFLRQIRRQEECCRRRHPSEKLMVVSLGVKVTAWRYDSSSKRDEWAVLWAQWRRTLNFLSQMLWPLRPLLHQQLREEKKRKRVQVIVVLSPLVLSARGGWGAKGDEPTQKISHLSVIIPHPQLSWLLLLNLTWHKLLKIGLAFAYHSPPESL